jgi:hypothetical protein
MKVSFNISIGRFNDRQSGFDIRSQKDRSPAQGASITPFSPPKPSGWRRVTSWGRKGTPSSR